MKLLASEVISKHVRHNDRVVAVGPNASLMLDPSAFFVASHLGKSGRLVLLDAQANTMIPLVQEKIRALEQAKKAVPDRLKRLLKKLWHGLRIDDIDMSNLGDPQKYSGEMALLKKCGFPIRKPEIAISYATETPWKNNSVDVVLDHGSTPWVGNPEYLLKEYFRILRPGGRAIIFISSVENAGQMKARLRELLSQKPLPKKRIGWARGLPRYSASERRYDDWMDFIMSRHEHQTASESDFAVWKRERKREAQRDAFDFRRHVGRITEYEVTPAFDFSRHIRSGIDWEKLPKEAKHLQLCFTAAQGIVLPLTPYKCMHAIVIEKRRKPKAG